MLPLQLLAPGILASNRGRDTNPAAFLDNTDPRDPDANRKMLRAGVLMGL